MMCDPDAVQACADAGVGSEITVPIGGRGIPEQGGPVPVTGRVRDVLLFPAEERARR